MPAGRKRTPAERKREKRVAYLHKIGLPPRVPAEPSRKHIAMLESRGVNHVEIARRAGLFTSVISSAKTSARVARETEAAILAVKTLPSDPAPQARIPVLGAQRILQGLAVAGYPTSWVSARIMGRDHAPSLTWMPEILAGTHKTIRGATYHKLVALAQKLEMSTPENEGVTKQASSNIRNLATRRNWSPLHCWDWGTITDPAQVPEWTGSCGTLEGYRKHYDLNPRQRFRITNQDGKIRTVYACEPCRAANMADVAERRERKASVGAS